MEDFDEWYEKNRQRQTEWRRRIAKSTEQEHKRFQESLARREKRWKKRWERARG
jgi:hypothetical protein